MKLILVRHGEALDLDEMPAGRRSDPERTLSREGQEEMRRIARGLAQLVAKIDVIFASPYKRTVETAQILNAEFPKAEFATLPVLAAGEEKDDLLSDLAGYEGEEVIALVGHEPDMSYLLTRLVSDSTQPFVGFKKGAMALVEFDCQPRWRNGRLLWHLPPAVLRRIK